MDSIVKFVDIRDRYFTQTDLRFDVLTNSDTYKLGVKICLRKVGRVPGIGDIVSAKCTGKVVYKYGNTDRDLLSVCFKASEVPEAGEDYYQFCYYTITNQLCGVSKHFQFTAPKNPESSVEERLLEDTKYSDRTADKKLDTMSNDLSALKTTVGKLTDLLSAKTTEDMSQLMACRLESEAKSERINALELSLKSLERDVNALRDENKSLKLREYQALSSFQSETKCKRIPELYANRHSQLFMPRQRQDLKAGEELSAIQINELRQQLTTTSVENTRLMKSFEDNESSVDVLKSQLMACRVESEAKSKRINALTLSDSRVESLERDVKALRDENKSLKNREYKGLDSSQSRVHEMLVLNGKATAQEVVIDELNEKLYETESIQKSIVEEWKASEVVFVKQINEMKQQLTTTSEEYQKSCEENTRLKESIDEMKTKVKNYLETKGQKFRAKKDLKAIIGSELGVEVLDSGSVASDNTSVATVSEDQELGETVIDEYVMYNEEDREDIPPLL